MTKPTPTPEFIEKNINEFLNKFEIFDDILSQTSLNVDMENRIALFAIYTITRQDQ